MDENFESDSRANDDDVKPSVTREDLTKTWIGLGAALEWIALRGQPTSLKLYRNRENEADEVLVTTLADLRPAFAESIVRGAEAGSDDVLVPVISGIWRQTATSDANDAGLPFRLIGTDEHDEWGGSIVRVSALREGENPGYQRVQIQSAFILERWPEHTLDINPVLPEAATLPDAEQAEIKKPSIPRSASVPPAVLRVIKTAINLASEDRAPITQIEMFELVKEIFPKATRNQVRDAWDILRLASKSGPRGAREPDRRQYIEKLGQRITPAELRN